MSASKVMLSLLAALTALSLTACSGTGSTTGTPSTTQPAAATQAKKGPSIKESLPAMKTAVVDLRKALSANDAAKAKTHATAVDDAWAKFEDEVKAKDQALYANIETQLGAVKAGAKADKFDPAPIKKAVGELDTLLYKLDPALAAEGIKSGAIEMAKEITALKDALAKQDAAKVVAATDKVYGVWYVFEHDAKAKDAEMYTKIEEPLNAMRSGVKQAPLDFKTLTDLTAKLEGLVATLTK